MNIYALLAATAGIFVLLHFVAVPKAEALLRRTVARNLPTRAALRSTLDLFRTIALITSISIALTVVTLWVINLLGGTTVAELTAMLEHLRAARLILLEIDPTLAVITTIVLIGAMVVLARGQARISAGKAYDEAVSMEIERVLDDGRNGRWSEIEPNAAMQKIASEMTALDEQRASLQVEIDQPAPGADGNSSLDAVQTHERAVGFAKARMQNADERMLWLQQAMLREEVQRRMDVRFDPTSLIPRTPETFAGRLATLLASRGVLTSLRGMSRVAFFASVLLLFPSMLALAAPGVGAALSARIETIEQLRVEADRKEASAAVAELKEAQASETQPTPDDAQVLDSLARRYEISLARHYAQLLEWPEATRTRSISAELDQERTREHIIRADGDRAVVQIAEIEPMDARMAALERAAAETRGPVTPAGRDFRTTLDQTIRRGMPQRWQELRKATIHAFAEFQQMPTPRELRAMLVGNIVHAGAGGVSPDLGSLLAEFDARLLEQMRLAETAHLTEALGRGKPPGAAFDEFASPHWHVPTPDRAFFGLRTVAQHAPTEQDILRRARDAHPGFAPKSPVNQDELHNLAARYTVAAYGEANSDRTAADALLGFNDHFPGALPPDPPASGSGGFPGGFGGGGGGPTGSSPRPHPTAPRAGGGGGAAVAEAAGGAVRAERVAMARSFSRLVGFRRIGGVLIGRPPSAEPHLDFTGFDWQDTGQVKLTLRRGDGRNIVLGPFRPEIVHLAMAYAADGRPITATMVTAAPLRELKILLHPALEDTAMGCRAIEVDRLVDRLAGSSKPDTPPSPREVESFRVQSFLELYHWAWAVTVTAGHDQVSKVAASPIATRVLDLVDGPAQRYLDRVAVQGNAGPGMLLQHALEERQLLLNPDYSPLSVKTAFFAPQQLSRLSSCAANTLEATRACLRQDVPALLKATAGDQRMEWTVPPPQIEIWSGVREASFEADPDLAFADAAASPQRAAPFAPLSFILQIAFTSEPLLAKRDQPWYRLQEGELDGISDEAPWQFPHLQPWIDQQVSGGIATARDAKDVFGAVREFTALQRLFRLALDGGLGPRFPLVRLGELADASRGWVRPGVHTPRWNPRPGWLEKDALAAAHVLSQMDDQPEKLRAAASSCVAAFEPMLENVTDRIRLAALPQAKWRESCRIPPEDAGPVGDQATRVVERFTQSSDARELRQRLGVLEEDKVLLDPEHRGCPPF